MARRISWHRNTVVIATVPLALLVLGCSGAGNAGWVPNDPNANGGGASSGATVGDDGASGGGTGSTGGTAGNGDDAGRRASPRALFCCADPDLAAPRSSSH